MEFSVGGTATVYNLDEMVLLLLGSKPDRDHIAI